MRTAFILAAGLGTRLRPLTERVPKALVPINGQPILQKNLMYLRRFGFERFIINTHYLAEQVQEFVQNFQPHFEAELLLMPEPTQILDTGGAVKNISTLLDADESVLVYNVDMLTNMDLGDFIRSNDPAIAARLLVSHRQSSRNLIFDPQNRLVGWQNTQPPKSKHTKHYQPHLPQQLAAFNGVHILNPIARQHFPETAVFGLIDWFLQLSENLPIEAYWAPENAEFLDIGTMEKLQQAQHFIV